MASGGARARSGPAPDPMALRRDREADWETLPAEGRDGPPPAWPLLRPISRELAVWEQEWRRPQAKKWEERQLEVDVALYVRRLVEAEKRGSAVALSTFVKQMREMLGLSEDGLRRNRWRIAVAGDESKSTRTTRPSSRSRLTVVPPPADGA